MGDAETLTHTQTVLSHGLFHVRIKPDPPDRIRDLPQADLASQGGQQLQILDSGQPRQEARRLDDNAEIGRKIHISAHHFVVYQHLPFSGKQEAADTFHQHRLSAAVVAHDAVDLSRRKVAADAVQDPFLSKILGDILNADRKFVFHAPPSVPVKLKLYCRTARSERKKSRAINTRKIATVCHMRGSRS